MLVDASYATGRMWNPVCVLMLPSVRHGCSFVYHLAHCFSGRANSKVDMRLICFVSSAQFVENIDLFFGIFLLAYLSVQG